MDRLRYPFRDFRMAEMKRMMNPLRDLRVQMELVRDPFKDFRVQMAKTERVVNPLRDLCTEKNYMDEMRRVVDDSRRFRVEMERVVNPLRDLRTEKNYMDEMRRVVDDSRRFRVEMERVVNPLRDLRVQMELARDPLKGFRDQMRQFDKPIVNFTHILDEIVKSAIPFISTRSVGIDVLIRPEDPEIGKQPVRIHYPDNSDRSFDEKVLILCGRDEEAKQTVARWVEKLGLEVVIIDEKPSGALTRIEKVERYTDDITFTVVLLTPDDVGKPKGELGEPNSRASQDVVLEIGILIGKYDRDRICFLCKGELELPSNMEGIDLVPIDANGGWILNLIKEMEFAGLPINISKAI